MNRLTATMMSLAIGLTSAKCTSEDLPGSNTINAYASDVRSDIGHIGNDSSSSTDTGKSTADTNVDAGQQDTGRVINFDNPCTKQLGQKWQTLLSGEYHYNPPATVGSDRATLDGVTKQDVLALAQLIEDKVITKLCYAQETVDPIDPAGNAVRVCDSVDVEYNGPKTPENEDVYVLCHIEKDFLPQGPKLNPNFYDSILEDEVSLSANTALGGKDYELIDEPAIYKNRTFQGKDGFMYGESFFMTGGGQDPKWGTGDFKRRSRVWISGK